MSTGAYPMARTAYDAGLSYFPDVPAHGGRVSGWTDFIALAPIPGSGLIAQGAGLAVNSTGGGNATDQKRQARVNWTLSMAQRGSPTAAAIIVAAPSNVGSYEAPMWRAALSQVPDTVLTASRAQYPGGWWPVGLPDFYTDTTGSTHQTILREANEAGRFGVAIGGAVGESVNTVARAVTRPGAGWLVGALVVGAVLLTNQRGR